MTEEGYLFISLQAQARNESCNNSNSNQISSSDSAEPLDFSRHQWWDFKLGWKSTLNNVRLIIQPYIFWNLIKPWVTIFFNTNLQLGFQKIMGIMNLFLGYVPIESG